MTIFYFQRLNNPNLVSLIPSRTTSRSDVDAQQRCSAITQNRKNRKGTRVCLIYNELLWNEVRSESFSSQDDTALWFFHDKLFIIYL